MIVKLDEIYTGLKESILIDEDIIFDEETYHLEDIKQLKDVHLCCKIARDSHEEIMLQGTLTGKMTILDSINLEKIDYPFSISLDENLEEIMTKDKNTIDIMDILWQNIVLEVPLRYTKVTDYSKYSGDGWRLISEEDLKYENNPFRSLLENEKEE